MTYQFTVSPDFSPEHIAGWHIFNTWLQRQLSETFHFEMYDSFEQQRQAIQENRVDLIYANPYDAAMLVRDKGFLALVKPLNKADEAVVAVSAASEFQTVEDLPQSVSLASTEDPDVHMMGMIMLEPADISSDTIERHICDTYILVAKQLLQGKSQVGLFLKEAYDDLSGMIKKQLRPLVTSQISIIHHALLLGPALAARQAELQEVLLAMNDSDQGRSVLDSMGLQGWEMLSQEEMEFMVDLMHTLVDEN